MYQLSITHAEREQEPNWRRVRGGVLQQQQAGVKECTKFKGMLDSAQKETIQMKMSNTDC